MPAGTTPTAGATGPLSSLIADSLNQPDTSAASPIDASVPRIEIKGTSDDVAPPPSLGSQAGDYLKHQLGLTARSALEGAAQGLQIFTEPARYITDKFLPDRSQSLGGLVTGAPIPPKSTPLEVQASKLADYIGLPSPQTTAEKVAAAPTKAGFGVLGLGGLAGLADRGINAGATQLGDFATKYLPRSTGDLLQALKSVPSSFTANPLASVTGAVGSSAGDITKQFNPNLNPWLQGGISLAGGVAGGMTPSVAQGIPNAFRRLTTPNLTTAQLDTHIGGVLSQAGMDYGQLPPVARVTLRNQLTPAIQAGQELDPEATARLAAIHSVGGVPTLGAVTQQPGQITAEQNLAKRQASSNSMGLNTVGAAQRSNNLSLIGSLNGQGAETGNLMSAGQSVMDGIRGRNTLAQAGVSNLYDQAKALPGGDTALARAPLVNDIFGRLAADNRMRFLPPQIGDMLNDISYGQTSLYGQTHDVPFNANTIDNLHTMAATAMRGTSDGNVKAALGHVIDGLNAYEPQTATGGGAPLSSDFIDAFRTAKDAARQRFQWSRSSPVIEDALATNQDGRHITPPDSFIQDHVINGPLSSAQTLAHEAPGAQPAVRDAILTHLKSAALGGGGSDEFGNFSQSNFRKALNDIGDDKLNLFFTPDEVAQLHNTERAAGSMIFQPRGSAVNNANTAAAIAAQGIDSLAAGAKKLPFVSDMARGWADAGLNRRALNPVPGLLRNPPAAGPGAAPFLLSGTVFGGGLLGH